MKALKRKPAGRQKSARPTATARTKAKPRRRSAGTASSTIPQRAASRAAVNRGRGSAKPPSRSQGTASELPPFAEAILTELRAIQSAVTPKARAVRPNDDGLEAATHSIRRVLSDCLERDHESLLRELVLVRQALADPQHVEIAGALGRLESLLDRLGGLEFSPAKLDYVDPAIHEIRAERWLTGVPEGVVAETLRSGFRTRSGVVIAKAWIAVNRRSAHEPARD